MVRNFLLNAWTFIANYARDMFGVVAIPTEKLRIQHFRKCLSAIGMNFRNYCIFGLITGSLRLISFTYENYSMSFKANLTAFYAVSFSIHYFLFRNIKSNVASLKVNDGDYPKAVRMSWITSLVLTLGVCFAMKSSMKVADPEDIGFRWAIFLVWQLYVCIWLSEGMILRIICLMAFNGTMIWCYPGDRVKLKMIVALMAYSSITALALCFAFKFNQIKAFMLKRMLKEQKEIYEQFIEKIEDPVAIFEANKIIKQNAAARRELGTTLEEIVKAGEFTFSQSGLNLNSYIQKRVNSEAAFQTETIEFYKHDLCSELIDQYRTLQVTFIDSLYMSRPKTVAIIIKDITSQRKFEEQKAEEKYKNMILFSLSHELRTPLNMFQGFLDLISTLHLDGIMKDSLKMTKGACMYLRNKICNILDYAQHISGQLRLHPNKFYLRAFCLYLKKGAIWQLGKKAKEVSFEVEVEERIPDSFVADKERLEEVLYVLIINAIKFTEKGKITLSVKETGRDQICFEVTDTGGGMPHHVVENLFKKQDLKSTTAPSQTTGVPGLGLTLSKIICGEMGSSIMVASEEGKGSSFSFTMMKNVLFPEEEKVQSGCVSPGYSAEFCEKISISAEISKYQMEKKPSMISSDKIFVLPKRILSYEGSKAGTSKPCFLVVDDNDLNRFVAKSMLSKHGIKPLEACNGKEALSVITSHLKEKKTAKLVIFMDLDMPVMNGIEATEEIRKLKISPRPVITALTAFAAESERQRCIEVGMDYFLSKPLTRENFELFLRNFSLI